MSIKIITFGCRLNTYESEILKQEIDKSSISDELIVINSCAVTNEAERQLKQAIRKADRENPNATIILTGCASQIYPEKYAVMPEIDLVIGNKEKIELIHNIKEYLKRSKAENKKAIVSDIQENSNYFNSLPSLLNYESRDRAFVQIQNGCNHRCTYCIIPYGRGKSVSVPQSDILNQIKVFCDNGYQEIILTGVDITEYGFDLNENLTLASLIKKILNDIPNLPRLRLSSIDVAEVDDELLDLMCNEKRLMPHFHISLQSGDNMILKRMMRRHTREDVINFCNKVRKAREGVAFGCDIIAGFPTETDEMFLNSLKLIEEAGIAYTHVFPYSIREGTPAAKMQQVNGKIKRERARLLREAGEKELSKLYECVMGTKQNILLESNGVARSENFLTFKFNTKNNKLKPGNVYEVLVDDVESCVIL